MLLRTQTPFVGDNTEKVCIKLHVLKYVEFVKFSVTKIHLTTFICCHMSILNSNNFSVRERAKVDLCTVPCEWTHCPNVNIVLIRVFRLEVTLFHCRRLGNLRLFGFSSLLRDPTRPVP